MLRTYFWSACHLLSWFRLLLQGICPSVTPWNSLVWSSRHYFLNVSWVHQHTYLYTMLYVLFFRYCKYFCWSLLLPRHASCSSALFNISWWKSLGVECNNQDIFSTAISTWYLQSPFNPCHYLHIKKYQKYFPWNV